MVEEGKLDVGGNSPQKLCLVAICYHNMAVSWLDDYHRRFFLSPRLSVYVCTFFHRKDRKEQQWRKAQTIVTKEMPSPESSFVCFCFAQNPIFRSYAREITLICFFLFLLRGQFFAIFQPLGQIFDSYFNSCSSWSRSARQGRYIPHL